MDQLHIWGTEKLENSNNKQEIHSKAYYVYMPSLLLVCSLAGLIYSVLDNEMILRIRLSAIFVTLVLSLALLRKVIAAVKDLKNTDSQVVDPKN